MDSVNAALRDASALAISCSWALACRRQTIATTSMGRNAAVMLHLVSELDKIVPTIWVDTGYNLRDTYVVAERLIRDLNQYARLFPADDLRAAQRHHGRDTHGG